MLILLYKVHFDLYNVNGLVLQNTFTPNQCSTTDVPKIMKIIFFDGKPSYNQWQSKGVGEGETAPDGTFTGAAVSSWNVFLVHQ